MSSDTLLATKRRTLLILQLGDLVIGSPEFNYLVLSRAFKNKIYCSSRDQSLSDLLYSKTKQKHILKKRAEIPVTTSGHLQPGAQPDHVQQRSTFRR